MSNRINDRQCREVDKENTIEKILNVQGIEANKYVLQNNSSTKKRVPKRKRKDDEAYENDGTPNTKEKATETDEDKGNRWPRRRSREFSESGTIVTKDRKQDSSCKSPVVHRNYQNRSAEKQINPSRLASTDRNDKNSRCDRDQVRKKSVTLGEAKQKAAEEREKKQQEKLLKKQELEARKLEREREMKQRLLQKEVENKAKEMRRKERERLRLDKKEQEEKLKQIRQREREERKQLQQKKLGAKLEEKRQIQETKLKHEKEHKNYKKGKKAKIEKKSYNVWETDSDDEADPIATRNDINLISNARPSFHKAWEIESEGEDDYQKLAALDDLNLVSNVEPFECPICIKNIANGEGVILHDCLHSFCKECLAGLIEQADRAIIRCPFQNAEYACESYLQDREIKSLVVPEVYEKHLQRRVGVNCKTPYCPGWGLYEDYVSVFLCPVCKLRNCLTCAAVHEGMTCDQYQDHVDVSYGINEQQTKENFQSSYFHNTGEANFEEKSDYQAILVALDDANLVSNIESFICPICFTNIGSGVGVILHDCLHSFCKECLAGVIQHSETPLVRCPFQNDDYTCESHLQEREIKSLVSPEIYEKHLQRSIVLAESQAPNSFHCKTTDCPGWCLYEDDVNNFVCAMCNKNNCLTCAAIHEGKNCKQYQDYVAFNCDTNEEAKRTKNYLQSMLEKGEAMECPKCQITIMKKNGCDALTCSMCHTEICWVTKGARWGPKGKGDYSGGCRCNYNGQRCHPKCGNCH